MEQDGFGDRKIRLARKNKKTHHETKYVEGTTIVSVGAAENAYANINKFQVYKKTPKLFVPSCSVQEGTNSFRQFQ